MIDFEDAKKKVLNLVKPLGNEAIPLERALARALAQEIRAKEPVPPFRKAVMDGYAFRSMDLISVNQETSVELKVIKDLKAGKRLKTVIKPGQAIKIMTGAPIPPGADSVVAVEDTESREDRVIIKKKVSPGENVGEIGEDIQKNELVLEKGEIINSSELGLIASLGYDRIKVSKKPKVAIIATGDEIAEPGRKLKSGQIRNSNGYSLYGLAVKAGADASYLGIARDKKGSLKKLLNKARGFDIVVLSGGVSVGDYDLVKDQLKSLRVKAVFWQAKIKPGKPVFFGVKGKQLVFGLPGNPVSAMVTFYLFVRPAIDKMLGKKQIGLRSGKAILMEDISFKPGRRQFLRGTVDQSGLVIQVVPFPNQKSGVLKSMVKSNVLIVVPPEIEMMEKGEEVEVLYLD